MIPASRDFKDILVVDDTPSNLDFLLRMLKEDGYAVRPVLDGAEALAAARSRPPALVLLDINMPRMNGYEVCHEFKRDPLLAQIPVIFLSSLSEADEKLHAFAAGGIDYITKPFNMDEVRARVETHLKVRRLQVELDSYNRRLEEMVRSQVSEIWESQVSTIIALATLSEGRDENMGNHILRVQRFCRALARRLASEGSFGSAIDGDFIDNLYYASALHDIGKVGIPDAILLKPGMLTPGEFEIMKTHCRLGADTLASVLRAYPKNAFVKMGAEVARFHHEYWDGSGYPEGIAGEAIPLSARILAMADRYDALRSRRSYKCSFDAADTFAILTRGDGRIGPEQIDPRVLSAFKSISGDFDDIYAELAPRDLERIPDLEENCPT